MTFRVWAPLAGKMDLELAGTRLPMRRLEDGWWEHEVLPVPGSDYRFLVDDRPLPDPRSPWQPAGVRGPSRTVDHDAFQWSDAGWRTPRLSDCVLYELHVGTFSPEGTFEGVIPLLDHLVNLGVDAIELMPVAEFAGDRGWGYDGVDLYAPHHAYGGPEGLKRLVDACHARGLAVVLDVVYNHLGPEGNYLGCFGPYFTDRYATPWGSPPNFDGPDSQPVRDFMIDNAVAWLRDFHVDGLRLDAVHAILDMSALHFLEELSLRVEREVGPERWVIAESDRNDPRLVMPRDRGGFALHAHWADDYHHAVHAVLTGERSGYYADFGEPSQLATALRRAYVYAGGYSAYRRRRHGRPHHVDGDRFVVCIQNHDQVGNRAQGDRLGHLVSPGRSKIAAALLLCSPFVPLLFMGEEWGASSPFPFFSSHTDPEIARATSEGRMGEFAAFGWRPDQVPDPQAPEVFQSARLRWQERSEPVHRDMLEWYRELIAIRRRHPQLHAGPLGDVRVEHGPDWLVLHRPGFAVAANWGAGPVQLSVPGKVLLASSPEFETTEGRLRLPSDAAALLQVAAQPESLAAAS